MLNHRNSPIKYEDISIGYKVIFEVEITEDLHKNFGIISGDFSPIHCDDDYAKNTKFGQKIGYAYLLTGFLSRLYGEYLPGGNSICIKQDAKFPKPYFINDLIRIEAEVLSKIDSVNFLEIKTKMYRNAKDCVFEGVGTVQITN